MINLHGKNWIKTIIFSTILLFTPNLWAATTGGENLPFESTLDMLQKSISGPVLTSISIIMVAITCVMLAFGEWGDGFKRVINIVLWLSVAFSAVSFLNHMFAAGATF
jgi:type IV secretory pathway VirB2 component (pilin)